MSGILAKGCQIYFKGNALRLGAYLISHDWCFESIADSVIDIDVIRKDIKDESNEKMDS